MEETSCDADTPTPTKENTDRSPIHVTEKTERSPIHGPDKFTVVDDGNISETRTCCAGRCVQRWDPSLVKYKSFFFFFGGAIGCVFPYFSIYYKQIGFSPRQIGILSGVRPLIGFCSGSIWGSIADRFRIRRAILILSATCWLAFITSIGFVPPPKLSDDQCFYVNDLIEGSPNHTWINPNIDVLHDNFYDLHKPRSDITSEESLQESRGWMYDYADLYKVFMIIMVLVILGELVQAPCGALADSGCIDHLGSKQFNKYGHQRAWGSLGLCVFSLIVGWAVHLTRRRTKACDVDMVVSNYQVAFYVFAGAMFCCVVTTFFFKFQKQVNDHTDSKPKPNPLKVFRMFMTLHYGSWLVSMFITGVCNGVIWGFLFWHLENLGGTQLLLGVANAVCLMSEMIMFLFVFKILEHTGCLPLMVFGLAGYTARFIVFALIENPWVVLPFEILQGFTFAGVWSVFTKYLCYDVPSEYLGTLQGFLHGVYWGLGAGSGSLIGGVLVENYGARVTFWIFAITSFVNMIVFLIIQKCTVRPDVFGNYKELDKEQE